MRTSQVTATMFVPRRILYELRSARMWYAEKERCVFCDIVRQEEKQGQRIVDTHRATMSRSVRTPRVCHTKSG